VDSLVAKSLSGWWYPRYETNPVKAHETVLSAYPKVAILGLGNSFRCSYEDGILQSPGRMLHLRQVSSRNLALNRRVDQEQERATVETSCALRHQGK